MRTISALMISSKRSFTPMRSCSRTMSAFPPRCSVSKGYLTAYRLMVSNRLSSKGSSLDELYLHISTLCSPYHIIG